MADEIPAPPVETPEVQTPPPPAPVQAPAPPPAAHLVLNGEKSEREIKLERDLENERERAKKAEIIAAEHQAENQRLKEIPASPKTPKVKRKHNWFSPVIGAGEEE